MKIKHIFLVMASKPDGSGNSYYAFRYIRTEDGHYAEGTISGGESNVRSVLYHMNGKEHVQNYFFTVNELPIREWNRTTKDFEYAGTNAEQVISFIELHLRAP